MDELDEHMLDVMRLVRSVAKGVALALIIERGDPEAALKKMAEEDLSQFEDPDNSAIVKGVAEQAIREAAVMTEPRGW